MMMMIKDIMIMTVMIMTMMGNPEGLTGELAMVLTMLVILIWMLNR